MRDYFFQLAQRFLIFGLPMLLPYVLVIGKWRRERVKERRGFEAQPREG
jgi:hypothetical protein